MSTSSTVQVDFDSAPITFRSTTSENKRRYASAKMNVLISKYKNIFKRRKIKTFIPDVIGNFQTINYSNKILNDKKKKEHNKEKTLSSQSVFNTLKKTKDKACTINTENKLVFSCSQIKKQNQTMFQYQDRNFINEYIDSLYSRNKQANSLYRVLNDRKNSFIKTIKDNLIKKEESKRKIVLGLSPFPTIGKNLELKIQETDNNIVSLYDKAFKSPAISERYERHMNELLRLKHVIKNIKGKDSKKRDKYCYRMLSNYLAQNGIFDKKYYSDNYLSNFKDFLEINFDINPKISYKGFLYDILNGEYDKFVQNPLDSKNSSLAYFEEHNKSRKVNVDYYSHHKTYFPIKKTKLNFNTLILKNFSPL